MDRRTFLLGSTVGLLGSLSGCSGPVSDTPPTGETVTPEGFTTGTPRTPGESPSPDRRVSSVANRDLPIPRDELITGVPPGVIRAIVDPAFDRDWSNVAITREEDGSETTYEPRLTDGDPVIGIERDGAARAYPLRVLNSHEIVNDTFEDPILVTYCPVCASAVVASRVLNGERATFDVSGLLWQLNLVMIDDRTRSLWSQVAATAIRGELTGTTLDLRPSTVTSWGEWQATNPDTAVLLPPPFSKLRYHDQPGYEGGGTYVRNEGNTSDGQPDGSADLDRGQFTHVLGVSVDGAAKAYPLPVVVDEGVVNDTVGGLPVVVTATPGRSMTAFVRRIDGRTLSFTTGDDRHLQAGRSRWLRSTGTAVDGPYADLRLDRATFVPQMFWETWLDFHPDTTVYGDYTFERSQTESTTRGSETTTRG